MTLDPALVAELARRKPPEDALRAKADEAAAIATMLRARFDAHPKQRAFWQSPAKRLAGLCTRRAGKSDGGVHEWLAKALTIPGWRAVYVNTTKKEARSIVWKNDLGMGWCDLIARHGTVEGDGFRIGGVFVKINETLLEINFDNGSQIGLFGTDDAQSINKLRGQAKDEVWIDEAQKLPHLAPMITQVLSPLVKDKRGVLRMTGTPSEDCAGYFYDATPELDSGDRPLPNWEVHRWSVVDNPGFGATPEERWARTAGEALTEFGWSGDEPEFLREWMGRWVKTDARYVYPVHSVPRHVLVYAPQRLTDNPVDGSHALWYDHDRAVLDLPRRPNGRHYEWLFSIGADFGYAQTAFALTMWAFSFERPDIYEMISWKQHKVLPDDQRQYLELLWNCTNNIVAMVGDPAGQKLADLDAWRTRMDLPIEASDKSAKNTWQELLAGDIRKGLVHYRDGSPLLHESTHLVYLPTKPGKTRKDDEFRRISDGTVPGSDAADAALYAYRYLHHHRYRDRPVDPRDELEKQADGYREAIDYAEQIRNALEEYGGYE